jgi:TrmH family RNA methyltransferase
MPLKESFKLTQKKHREESGRFLAEGPRVVAEGLRSGWPCACVYYTDNTLLRDLVIPAGVKTWQLTEKEMGRFGETVNSQGLVAEFITGDLASPVIPRTGGVLYLDAIQDPGNIGVLLRSGLGAGVRTVVAGPGTGDPFNPKAIRASAGMFFHLKISRDDADRTILKQFKAAGFRVFGAATRGGEKAADLVPVPKWVLVAGNEGQGLSPGTEKLLDTAVTIKIDHALESLNVSVSAGILLFKLSGKI